MEFLLPFSSRKCVLQRKSEDIQEIAGTFVFFCCVAFLIMRSHLSTTFCVACLSSDLHASLWNLRLDKHTCCSHPQKKTSLQVLFGTFRQILDESARIRSSSPSVVSQNGVGSVYSHVDLHAVTLEATYGNMVPNNGKCSSYSHV